MTDRPVEQGHGARLDLGAYLIGSLAPTERAAVERHLATCLRCRAELAELAPLPGLLAQLDVDAARHHALAPSSDMPSSDMPSADILPRALDALRRGQETDRRRLRRWRAGTAVAAVVAAAATVVVVVSAGQPVAQPGPPGVPFTAVATGGTAAGTGVMEPRGWGTAVRIELTGLPPAARYQVYATARDGHGEVAATWGFTPGGRAVVSGATAIQRADLASIEVRTVDGRTLLNLPC